MYAEDQLIPLLVCHALMSKPSVPGTAAEFAAKAWTPPETAAPVFAGIVEPIVWLPVAFISASEGSAEPVAGVAEALAAGVAALAGAGLAVVATGAAGAAVDTGASGAVGAVVAAGDAADVLVVAAGAAVTALVGAPVSAEAMDEVSIGPAKAPAAQTIAAATRPGVVLGRNGESP